MKSTLLPVPACLLVWLPCCAMAATTLDYDKQVHTVIPDNDDRGLGSIITVPGSGLIIASVEVLLTTEDGWNGDMYAYLEHNSVITVLFNRPGRSSGDPAGAASGGMQIRFADDAAADVHTAISNTYGTTAAGTYQPDARAADPAVVTDASPRTLFLGSFSGQDAGGDWTLFVADVSGGEVATLQSWGLSVTLVPEPSTTALLLCGAAATLLIRRRH